MFAVRRRIAAALAVLCLAAEAAAEETELDLALVLAIDVSSSVDFEEYVLQLTGYAEAFRDSRVTDAIAATGGIAIAVTQWAGTQQQDRAIDWRIVREPADAARLAGEIETMARAYAAGSTDLSAAIAHALAQFSDQPGGAARRVIDISGDGPANVGTAPSLARDRAVGQGLTVNGLAIMSDVPTLDRYYRDEVVGGPGAFVHVAAGYEPFGDALVEKLVREIEGPLIAVAPDRPQVAEVSPPPRRGMPRGSGPEPG